MLLAHQTNTLKEIIIDGYLRPSSETKIQYQNPYENIFLTDIFFSTLPYDINIIKLNNIPCLYFDSEILYTHKFYTNKTHSAGKTPNSKSYPRYYKNTNIILSRLFKHSMKIAKEIEKPLVYYAFQEVLFSGKVNLKHLKYVQLGNNNNDLRKIINEKYPRVVIIDDILLNDKI